MLTYALGRGLERTDRCTVDDVTRQVVQNKFVFSSLVLGIVKSDPFLMRRKARGVMGKSFPISRRTALKGLGACIALPWLEAMLPRTAFGAPAPAAVPLRMAFLYVPNGKNMAEWTPKDEGAGYALTPTHGTAAGRSRTTSWF